MKIGVDLQVLASPRLTGVGRYTLAVLDHLLAVDKANHYRLFYNASFLRQSQRQKIINRYRQYPRAQCYFKRWPNKLLNGSLTFFNRPYLDKLMGGVDLFWLPSLHFWSISQKCPTVVTVHDLSFLKLPWAYSYKMRLWHKAIKPKRKLEQAKKIIAVSKSTKQDLIDLYQLPAEKIVVIYSGISKFSGQPSLNRVSTAALVKKKFILYLGTLEPRKNLTGLIAAYELLNKPEYDLVIAGSRGWLYQEIFALARQSKFKQQIKFIDYPEDELAGELYRQASVLVWPSFYEGFGLPPLEAMAAGCPVITSANSSLPEVAGPAAVLVNPYNIKEIAQSMRLVLDDANLRQSLINKGYEQVKKFSWQQSAEKMLEIFETVNNKSSALSV